MMEQRRDERNGFDGSHGHMHHGRHGMEGGRPGGFGPMGFENDGPHGFHAMHGHGGRGHGGGEECRGMHDPRHLREAFMRQFSAHGEGFSRMHRGVFDPRGFREGLSGIEIRDLEDEYVVEASIPGVKKESIRLEHLPGMLTIKTAGEENAERPLFLRHCDEENICATCRDGILEIRIPKSKGKKIDIE